MRTVNPVLNENRFTGFDGVIVSERMTVQGTALKTLVLTVLVVIAAAFTWRMTARAEAPAAVMPWAMGGALFGFVIAIVTTFKAEWSPFTAPLYAAAEGLLLGALSALFEMRFPGIVLQAVGLTIGTLITLLGCYLSGVIKATENFKLGVVAATGGVCLVYLATIVLSLFSVSVPFIHSAGPVGILFSGAVVVIAAMNLVLDFDFIEQGAEHGAPKYMEWYGAFGLMVTLIWLYIAMLRLLSKLRSRS